MIRFARVGNRVQLWYRKSMAAFFPFHGQAGLVVAAGHGPGPKNVGVRLDSGRTVVVPSGNLRHPKDSTP